MSANGPKPAPWVPVHRLLPIHREVWISTYAARVGASSSRSSDAYVVNEAVRAANVAVWGLAREADKLDECDSSPLAHILRAEVER